MKYSEGFRSSILRRVLPPSNQGVNTVAREFGVIGKFRLLLDSKRLDDEHIGEWDPSA